MDNIDINFKRVDSSKEQTLLDHNVQAVSAGIDRLLRDELIYTKSAIIRHSAECIRSVPISLLDQDSQPLPVMLELRGTVEDTFGHGYIKLSLQDENDANAELAFRTYKITKDNGMLFAISDMNVEIPFRELGLGKTLVKKGEEVKKKVADQLASLWKISKLKSQVTDGTGGKERGWTTRLFSSPELGYTQTDKKKFEKIEDLDPKPIQIIEPVDDLITKTTSRI